jgi:hypothetical protein
LLRFDPRAGLEVLANDVFHAPHKKISKKT